MAITRGDIREMLARRLEKASLAEIWDLAQRVPANDEAPEPRGAIDVQQRFTKLDLRGHRLTDSAEGWVAVYDAETDLTWTRDVLECGEVNWKDAKIAAANMRMFGKEDWRAPTLKEQISIIDYTRLGPALDTTYFSKHTGWCWTSTVDAENPSVFAWVVYLHSGGVNRRNQTRRSSVRAVRAGQPLELGL